MSSVIPRGSSVETRILAAHQPHPQTILANPTLEEAYLLFQEEVGQAERASSNASPKQASPT